VFAGLTHRKSRFILFHITVIHIEIKRPIYLFFFFYSALRKYRSQFVNNSVNENNGMLDDNLSTIAGMTRTVVSESRGRRAMTVDSSRADVSPSWQSERRIADGRTWRHQWRLLCCLYTQRLLRGGNAERRRLLFFGRGCGRTREIWARRNTKSISARDTKVRKRWRHARFSPIVLRIPIYDSCPLFPRTSFRIFLFYCLFHLSFLVEGNCHWLSCVRQ